MNDVRFRKTLGAIDLTLFAVSAIVLLDPLAATASIGPSSLTWWVVLGLFFALPIGLITAEMGSAYPEQGGIYAWIRNAFGPRWASRAAWAYWVNTAVWLPSIYVLFSGFLSKLFGLNLPLGAQIGVSIALVWAAVFVNCISLEAGKWAPNLGAIFKMIIFSVLIVGGLSYGAAHGFANEFPREAMVPAWSDSLKYLPAIIYGMLGFELASAGGAEINNPQRDLPISILLSGVLIIALYALSTAAILAVLPAGEINLVEGLIDVMRLFFGDGILGEAAVIVLGLMALFTFYTNGVTWALGCNRASTAAAIEGQLPALFAITDRRHGAPIGSAILMGVVCTIVLLVYGRVATSNEDLFWNLFAFSAVIFLAPYAGMSAAFLLARLRRTPAAPGAFRVPGGLPVAFLLTGFCIVSLLGAIALLLYVPGEGLQRMTAGGVAVTLLIGEVLILFARSGRRRPRTV